MIFPGGILLADKPPGMTSFAVVNHVRKVLAKSLPANGKRPSGGPRPPRFKCGHAGTLDPLATGLLVVLVGKASRLSPFMLGMDKAYQATVRFGTGTDTLDRDGETTGTGPLPESAAAVAGALPAWRGPIQQVPPIYSALKRDGQPLYKLARSGQDVAEPEARPVTIHALELGEVTEDPGGNGGILEVELLVRCSSGTYIRSLGRDLAAELGTVGHLTALRRTEVGPFSIDDAMTGFLDWNAEQLLEQLIPAGQALPHLPWIPLAAGESEAVRLGHQPQAAWMERLKDVDRGEAGPLFRMLDPDGDLVAVGRLEEPGTEPRIVVVIPAALET